MRQPTVLGKDARVHEKTLKNLPKEPICKKPRKKCERTKLNVIKADERVWEQALALAGNDWRRLQIISKTEVIVHNRRVW